MTKAKRRSGAQKAYDEIERQFDEARGTQNAYIGEAGDGTEVVIDGKVDLKRLVAAIRNDT